MPALKISLPVLVMSVALTACQTTPDARKLDVPESKTFTTDMPIGRLHLPEAPGKANVAVNLDYMAYSHTVITDTRATPNQQQVVSGSSTYDAMINAELGVTEQFSVVLGVPAATRPLLPEAFRPAVRYQLLGDAAPQAQRGNLSLSVGIGYLFNESSEEKRRSVKSCQLLVFCNKKSYRVLSLKQSHQGLDADMIVGFRPLDRLTAYAGVFYQDLQHDSRVVYIQRTSAPQILNRTISNGQFDTSVRGHNAGLSVDISDRLSLMAEYLQYQLGRDDDPTDTPEQVFNAGLRVNL
ncbi:MAG: hypothetical protein V2I38_13250 [Alcanivoracaceae bacterium]|jgi:hypothetical protein|nr:hypothetical protein [Alcanivoracaceae bacterium]